jgi:hypothetical protein
MPSSAPQSSSRSRRSAAFFICRTLAHGAVTVCHEPGHAVANPSRSMAASIDELTCASTRMRTTYGQGGGGAAREHTSQCCRHFTSGVSTSSRRTRRRVPLPVARWGPCLTRRRGLRGVLVRPGTPCRYA